MSRFGSGLTVAVAMMALVATQAGAHGYQLGALKIGQPWSRPTPPSAPTAAGFLSVTNTGSTPDRLVGAVSPAVDHIEIHSMTLDGGVMRMRPVSGGLLIAPGATVTLSPASYHLMMFGPKQRFKLGDKIPATLRFEHAGEIKVEFSVQAAAPPDARAQPGMGGMAGMGGMNH